VGASLDFLTGNEKRAPEWIQQMSLEWLYRLAQNPRRLARRYLVRGPRFFAHLRRARFERRGGAIKAA
jgi:UDP-N-acetyl-D-mannosaminuronic acid transferase (WecB/TagA/CpsF family)